MKKMFEMKCETIINITEANVEDGNFTMASETVLQI